MIPRMVQPNHTLWEFIIYVFPEGGEKTTDHSDYDLDFGRESPVILKRFDGKNVAHALTALKVREQLGLPEGSFIRPHFYLGSGMIDLTNRNETMDYGRLQALACDNESCKICQEGM